MEQQHKRHLIEVMLIAEKPMIMKITELFRSNLIQWKCQILSISQTLITEVPQEPKYLDKEL